jgi:hypothetical protein
MKLGVLVETNGDVVRHLDTDFLNRYLSEGNGTKALGQKKSPGT